MLPATDPRSSPDAEKSDRALADCRAALQESQRRECELLAQIERLTGELAALDPTRVRSLGEIGGETSGMLSGFDFGREKRAEKRLAFVELSIPLLGRWGQEQQSCRYRPLDVSPRGMRIEFLDAPGGDVLPGSLIDLCLPFLHNAQLLSLGTIRWSRPGGVSTRCGVTLSHRPTAKYPVCFDLTPGFPVRVGDGEAWAATVSRFLYRAAEDALIAKRATLLYLAHLTPLLVRLSRVNRPLLRYLERTNLDLTEHRIAENIRALQRLAATEITPNRADVAAFLRHFHELIRPEIDAFAVSQLDGTAAAGDYLTSIRQAERRLTQHHNAVVLLMEEATHGPNAIRSQ